MQKNSLKPYKKQSHEGKTHLVSKILTDKQKIVNTLYNIFLRIIYFGRFYFMRKCMNAPSIMCQIKNSFQFSHKIAGMIANKEFVLRLFVASLLFKLLFLYVYFFMFLYWYNITWILHHIFMYSTKVKPVAGWNNDTPLPSPFSFPTSG